ncbi:MAG: hypothetical protein QHC90_13570 [Shinella sp.]|jgi:hypothetical protein|nr:hypothetical protein [Shinella sp.]
MSGIINSAHIEGRLNAHRRLMVSLFSVIAGIPAAREALSAMIRENEIVSDHEEDPGIEPDEAFAAQQVADDEIRAILSAAMDRFSASRTSEDDG